MPQWTSLKLICAESTLAAGRVGKFFCRAAVLLCCCGKNLVECRALLDLNTKGDKLSRLTPLTLGNCC
jgi:hypothetical protein